jgi:hypothetical protein
MADQPQPNDVKPGNKYPLLVYRYIARRYRPAGVLLFVMGLFAQLPQFIALPFFKSTFFTPTQLAYVGAAALFAGAGIWIISLYMERRAYVQCMPDYLLIRSAFHTVAVAYQRFNSVQTVQVGRVFDIKSYKGRDRLFIRPLAAEPAIEAELSSMPEAVSEKRLHRNFSKFLFSPRTNGFIFIVPNYQKLGFELNAYIQRSRDRQRAAEHQGYLSPLERAQVQENRLF